MLEVRGLATTLNLPTGPTPVLDDVTFSIDDGEIVGMVGESGSGKSLTALSIARLLPPAARVTSGQIMFRGKDLLQLPEQQMRRHRGSEIGMVFQDPLAYLHPLKRIGGQLEEAVRVHGGTKAHARTRTIELLQLVGIPDARHRLDDYPHQFSGGMRQRVLIAMAVANDPALLIADEPTTALDVTIQAEVLAALVRLRQELGTAILLITHDMGIVRDTCDRVLVMYGGRIAEEGTVKTITQAPRHPYTRELLRSVPHLDLPVVPRLPAIPGQPPDAAHRPAGCAFHPRCPDVIDQCRAQVPVLASVSSEPGHRAACWVAQTASREPVFLQPPITEPTTARARTKPQDEPILVADDVVVRFTTKSWFRPVKMVSAVDGVSLTAHAGRTIGLVGESGCGKSTFARAALGLVPLTSGKLTIGGKDWATATEAQRFQMRRTVQLVFQDPYASLNPRMTIRDIIAEPVLVHHLVPPRELRTAVDELLDQVGLPARFADSYPYQLSGGQRQRVGIARAIALNPQLIVADEPVSALDVSIQAQVINLFADLRDKLGVGYVFIAHDLAVARHLSDEIVVMYLGRIVEQGPTNQVFAQPLHPYTRTLLDSVPGSGNAVGRTSVRQPAQRPPSGCRFADRCPIGPATNPNRQVCHEQEPPLHEHGGDHLAACHFPGELEAKLNVGSADQLSRLRTTEES